MAIAHQRSFIRSTANTLIAALLTAGLIGCSSDDDASTTSTISGSVFASTVKGSNCEFQDNQGNTVAGPFVTSSTGTYIVGVPNGSLAGELVLLCYGGRYTDEATGEVDTPASTLAAYVAAGTLHHGSRVHATPGSTIVYHIVSAASGGDLTAAMDAFTQGFGYTVDTSIAPTDATSPATGASEDELLAGLRAAAFSQLTLELGLTADQQFALLEALAKDLADGVLDADNGSNPTITIPGTTTVLPVDIQNRFATALLNFRSSGNDATGLANDQIGTLPFGKTALTTSYRVDYIEGSMPAMEGKTQFQISLTDLSNDQAVSGASVSLTPVMYMADKTHSTPVDGDCIESGTAGTYDCTVYYLMPTSMMGVSMGYWDLKVISNVEETHFYPDVMMAMGDTPLSKLKNSTDTITLMGIEQPRTYLLFKSSLTGTVDNHTFELYIATMENMMSFPPVYPSAVLSPGTPDELAITTMTVEVSTDPTFTTKIDALPGSHGYWSAAVIPGLANGTTSELYVRLMINGLTYYNTIDGSDTGNDYATFIVTPTASAM